MDIYTIAKEEANIKRQKEILDRKVLVDDMRKREAKMLEAFDDMSIIYEKHCRYKEETKPLNGWLNFTYKVFLTTEKVDKQSIDVKVEKNDFSITQNWLNRMKFHKYNLENLMEGIVEYIKKSNGC